MTSMEEAIPVLQTILDERQSVEDKMAACVMSIVEFDILPTELAEQYRDEMIAAAARAEEAIASIDEFGLVPQSPDEFEVVERVKATLLTLLSEIRGLRAAHDEVAQMCDERGITYAEHLAEALRRDPNAFTPQRKNT